MSLFYRLNTALQTKIAYPSKASYGACDAWQALNWSLYGINPRVSSLLLRQIGQSVAWPSLQIVLAWGRIALCSRQAVSEVCREQFALLALLLLVLLEAGVGLLEVAVG